MGSKPYIWTYVNVDEIFEAADGYMRERAPEQTRFEASCTSDNVGVDHLTHTLKKAIEYFGESESGRLRFVTKFAHVDQLITFWMQSIMAEPAFDLVSMMIT